MPGADTAVILSGDGETDIAICAVEEGGTPKVQTIPFPAGCGLPEHAGEIVNVPAAASA